MKYIVFLSLSIIFLFSCNNGNRNVTAEKDYTIETIQVMYYPAFIGSSVFTYNAVTSKISIQKMGYLTVFEVLPPPSASQKEKFEAVESSPMLYPKNTSYHIDNKFTMILDTIIKNFQPDDYNNMYKYSYDGIYNSILIVYSNDSIKEFTMGNNGTDNQYKLVESFIEMSLQQESDTTNLKYLKALKSYY